MSSTHSARAPLCLLAAACYTLAGCKPAATKVAPNKTTGEPSLPTSRPVRRQPSAEDFASFVRATLPPVLRLVDLKSDPPVPRPDAAPGANAWVCNVRLTFAPVEDELAEPPAQEAKAFQAVMDELTALVAWSDAYAQSPYARLYPALQVSPPTPAAPKLLRVLHAKDRPVAPVYGQMAAEWQVDRWRCSVLDLDLPEENGRLRSAVTGPVFVHGEVATEQYLAATKAAIAQAKEKKAAVEAAYQADLQRATRPGTLYRGQVSLGTAAVPAEVRFVEPSVADPQRARFEVRLPESPGFLFTYTAKLAGKLPIHPAAVAGSSQSEGEAELPKADLTVGLERSVGKESVPATLPIKLFQSYKYYDPPHTLPLSIVRGRIAGKLSTATGVFQLAAQQVQ